MTFITDRPLSAREFLDECLAFKKAHPVQSRFFSVFLEGKLTPEQLRLWAKDMYHYIQPAIPALTARPSERRRGDREGAPPLRHPARSDGVLLRPRRGRGGARRQRRGRSRALHAHARAAGARPPRVPVDGARAPGDAGGVRRLLELTWPWRASAIPTS